MLANAGATPGGIFGSLTDRAADALILGHDIAAAVDRAHCLGTAFVRDAIDSEVIDTPAPSVTGRG